jgi:hypothetical protein
LCQHDSCPEDLDCQTVSQLSLLSLVQLSSLSNCPAIVTQHSSDHEEVPKPPLRSLWRLIDPQDIPHPHYKYPRVNFLVFDDLVSDAYAWKKGHSAINHLTIQHRHLQCNLLFTTQYIKAIPPVLRRNLDIFVIFEFANVQSVVEQIYPEISGVIKEEDFKKIFEYATINKHDALTIDQTSKHIFKLNWDTALILN